MSILYNGGKNPTVVKYNGTSLDKVIYSGKVVWQKWSESVINCSGLYQTVLCYNHGRKYIGQVLSGQGGGATGTYTATGNILTKSTALSVKANRNCNVKVVGTFFASSLEHGCTALVGIYKNQTLVYKFIHKYWDQPGSEHSGVTINVNKTFELSTNDILGVMVEGGDSSQPNTSRVYAQTHSCVFTGTAR